MRQTTAEVLIVGAGPVGLFLAVELVRHGVRPIILDRRPSVPNYSRAIAIQPRTLEIMEPSGLTARLERAALRASRMRIVVGGQSTELSISDLSSRYPHVLLQHQSETERQLAEHLSLHGVEVEREQEVLLLSADDSGVDVNVQGPSGLREIRASYVIGCDGAASTVRRQAGIDWGGDELPMRFAVADVALPWDGARDETSLFLSREGLCALFPLPTGSDRWRVIADVAADVHHVSLTSIALLLRERAGIEAAPNHPTTLLALSSGEQIASSFRAGRVLIAGDAAHIHSPVGGQGMNTGLQDAHNLAWKLALVIRRGVSDQLLDSYEAERKPIAERVLRDTHQATKAATWRGLLPQVLRSSAVGLLAGVELAQRALLDRASEIDVSYRSSPIVRSGGPQGGLQGGDHLPDVRWGPQGSLSRLVGTKHLVLLFDGGGGGEGEHKRLIDAADMLASSFAHKLEAYAILKVDQRPEWVARGTRYLVDPQGHIHKHLGIDGATAIVVRPDGYLGYVGRPEVGDLITHLSQILGRA